MQQTIHRITFTQAQERGLVAGAAADKIVIRPTDIIFAIGSHAVACLRQRSKTVAIVCGCWTRPDSRGQGYGSAMVRHVIAQASPWATLLEVYAMRPQLFFQIGFLPVRAFKIGTTLMRKQI